MANAEQFGHLSLPLVKPLSILSLSLSLSLCPASNYYYCCHRGSYSAVGPFVLRCRHRRRRRLQQV